MRRREGLRAAALAAPVFVRRARAVDVLRFEVGVGSGQSRADRMLRWTGLSGDALPLLVEVQWELVHDDAFMRIAARGPEIVQAEQAHRVQAEPTGLDAGRWPWYCFRALGQQSRAERTRSAPAEVAHPSEPCSEPFSK